MGHAISTCLSCTSEQIAGVTMFSLTLFKFFPTWQLLLPTAEAGPPCSQTNLGLKSLEGLICQQQKSTY